MITGQICKDNIIPEKRALRHFELSQQKPETLTEWGMRMVVVRLVQMHL